MSVTAIIQYEAKHHRTKKVYKRTQIGQNWEKRRVNSSSWCWKDIRCDAGEVNLVIIPFWRAVWFVGERFEGYINQNERNTVHWYTYPVILSPDVSNALWQATDSISVHPRQDVIGQNSVEGETLYESGQRHLPLQREFVYSNNFWVIWLIDSLIHWLEFYDLYFF